MSLIDQFGRPINYHHKHVHSAEHRRGVPWESSHLADIDDLIPSYDWQILLAASRRLYTNTGITKGMIKQRANFSVGKSWDPVYKGEDSAWGKLAQDWLKDVYYPVCDVRGPAYNFKTNLYLDSIAIDRDGDYLTILTETKTGFPQTQRIGAHRLISAQDGILDEGKYAGLKICKGIISSRLGRPVAFRIQPGDDTTDFTDVPARNVIYNFDPEYYEQGRGIPCAVHAIDKLKSSARSEEWELMAQLMLSSIGLIEYNEKGLPDPNDPTNHFQNDGTTDPPNPSLIEHHMSGGTIRHIKSGSGNKLESIDQSRPGDVWETFQDRIARHFIAGVNWSYGMVWKSGDLTGTSQRTEIEKVRRSITDRQDLLMSPAKREVSYAIAKAIKLGSLPANKDWWRWGFTMPPELSIDAGRDGKVKLEEWRAGALNMGDWLGEKGKTLEEQYRGRAEELALRKLIQAEVEKKHGVTIDEREMSMIGPNDMPEDDNKNEEL